MQARIPKLGFLGLGSIGLQRMEAIVKSGSAEVAAIADPIQSARERAVQLAPGARIARGLYELLECGLDGLVIATPSALHAEQAIAALERGCAVFCQKPLGRNGSETNRVIDAARRSDRLLAVDLSYRRTDAMQKVCELLRSGELGDVYAVNLAFHNAYGPDKPWFHDRKRSGGGALIDLGTHVLDLALWVLEYPEVEGIQSRLFASGVPLSASTESVEDYAMAAIDLATGTALQLACSWKLHAGRDCVVDVAFYGTRAGVRFYNVDGSFYDFAAELMCGTSRRTLALPPDDWSGRALIEWARQLAIEPQFDAAALKIGELAELIDGIYERGRKRPFA